MNLPLDVIDPDDNFYNDLSCYSSTLCKYYQQDQFNSSHSKIVNEKKFSLFQNGYYWFLKMSRYCKKCNLLLK